VTDRLPARLSTILFDVGNTLHHLDHAFIAGAIARHSHPVEPRDVAVAEYAGKAMVDALFRSRTSGSDGARQFSYFGTILDALRVPPAAARVIVSELQSENARSCLWRVMDPGTAHILGELRRLGYTLGVVSNADGRVHASLAASGIADQFAVIVDSHVVGVEKPAARIFEIALTACQAQPSESVYVGDIYEIDVRGARNAGVTPVLLDPLVGYGEVDCPRITTLADIFDLLPHRAGE
jgi:FMN phosphatase YigB (HAD superfamily)